jgi:hypothetical protein
MSNATTTQGRLTPKASGWVTFAGAMMILAGFFQGIAGLVAIFKPTLYVANANNLVAFDYTQWGWIHLFLGIILIMSAFSLFSGHLWGRIVAITIATLSAVANFAFIWAYPFWSITVIIIDVLVIFAVARYGHEYVEDL